MPTQLPPALHKSLAGLPGYDAFKLEAVHEEGHAPVSIRLNPSKAAGGLLPPDIAVAPGLYSLSQQSLTEKIPWSSQGFRLEQRPAFIADPLWHAGVYYVQEASSMFLEEAIRQTVPPDKSILALDLCAAPGGKSTLIQSVLSPGSLLVSNEPIRSRAEILLENMTKWGHGNGVITQSDPSRFATPGILFDLMVVDAPCSGSGLFRREPEAIREWSLDQVRTCSLRQRRILADALPALKPGGILIYSTCSYSREENEEILDWLLDSFAFESVPLNTEESWNIVASSSAIHQAMGYRFYPDRLAGEGFFIACLRKTDAAADGGSRELPTEWQAISKKDKDRIKPWIREDSPLAIYNWQDEVFAFPAQWLNQLSRFQQAFYLRNAGIHLGKMAGNDFLPDHALAMSSLCSGEIPKLSVSHETAIGYLRKNNPAIDFSAAGWQLVNFRNMNLGWIKNLGKRYNNYYPKQWRILKEFNSTQ